MNSGERVVGAPRYAAGEIVGGIEVIGVEAGTEEGVEV